MNEQNQTASTSKLRHISSVSWKISNTLKFGNNLIVLFDPMDLPINEKTSNIRAYDVNGFEIWIAQQLDANVLSHYVNIRIDGAYLYANTYDCNKCTIDLNSGSLVESVFTK